MRTLRVRFSRNAQFDGMNPLEAKPHLESGQATARIGHLRSLRYVAVSWLFITRPYDLCPLFIPISQSLGLQLPGGFISTIYMVGYVGMQIPPAPIRQNWAQGNPGPFLLHPAYQPAHRSGRPWADQLPLAAAAGAPPGLPRRGVHASDDSPGNYSFHKATELL